MSEWCVEVVRLGPVIKHPNADTLEITHVHGEGGYPVIVKQGLWKEGDLVAYIPVDSVVDTSLPEFAWLAEEGKLTHRVKAKRLRGVFSMGLIVSVPTAWTDPENQHNLGMLGIESLAEFLHVTKYEPQPNKRGTGGSGERCARPGTDECVSKPAGLVFPEYTGIQGLRKWNNIFEPGEEVVVTEKIHGENWRATWWGNKLWVGSRHRVKALSTVWGQVAEAHGLAEKLGALEDTGLVLFGECHGYTGVFKYGTDNAPGLRLFDAIEYGRFLDYDSFESMANSLSIPIAPVLYRGPWNSELVRDLANGQSTLDSSHIREGIVIRPAKERYHDRLGRVILKLHGEDFLLRKGA